MKYAITYSPKFRFYSEIDEVVFNYTKNSDIDTLIKVALSKLLKQEQKIIIRIENHYDLTDTSFDLRSIVTSILQLKELHPNILVQIESLKLAAWVEILKDNKIPFMFYHYPKSMSEVCAMRLMGAEEVYITEDLGFHLDELQNMRKGGLRLRVYPNIAQAPVGCDALPEITKFWIRPEDTEIYEDYIDIMEFFPSDEEDRNSVIYEIYSKRQWMGQVEDIILSYHDKISNTTIAPHFGGMRVHCHKKCTFGNCNICTEIAQLGAAFDAVDFHVVKKKYVKPMDEKQKQKELEKLKQRGKDILNEQRTKSNNETMQNE